VQMIVGDNDNEMQPDDDDNKQCADKHHNGPLEPWLAVFRAETYLCQIAHKVAVSRELLANSGADRMIVEGSVGEKGRKNGTGREVCDRKVAVETNIFWYTLDNTSKTDSTSHGGCEEVCCGDTTKNTEAVDGPGI